MKKPKKSRTKNIPMKMTRDKLACIHGGLTPTIDSTPTIPIPPP